MKTRHFTEVGTVTPMLDGKHWQVQDAFEYQLDNGAKILVPRGFETDFASIPRLFWGVLPPIGKYTLAALVHDFLYQQHVASRKQADQIFYRAMREYGVTPVTAWVMYQAVRVFGAHAYHRWDHPHPDQEATERIA